MGAIDRYSALNHQKRLLPDRNRPVEIRRREGFERLHQDRPAAVPPAEDVVALCARGHLDLGDAQPIGFLAVGPQKIAEARAQIAAGVFADDRAAV